MQYSALNQTAPEIQISALFYRIQVSTLPTDLPAVWFAQQ